MTDSSHSSSISAPSNSTREKANTADDARREADSADNARQQADSGDSWNFTYDYGFEPASRIDEDTSVWITPDLLIANNAWRARHNLSELLFEAPAAGWLSTLPRTLTLRTAVTASVSKIRIWKGLPKGLGERPWSQLSDGRVLEFRAARRGLAELQRDLRNAPDDSLITVNAHVSGITEEWCVIIRNGQAVASSGYCVHSSPDEDSHDILTVFDNAKFHDSYRAIAESTATAAAQAGHLGNASILVGFRKATERKSAPSSSVELPQALVLEADPVWCTTPYPYESFEEAGAFLEAIADSRLRRVMDGTLENRLGDVVAPTAVYCPDPWMARYAAHRYDRF